jgi:hypothetical protein
MHSKHPFNFKVRESKKHITITMPCKLVVLTFTLIVLLFYFNGITESALAQLSTTTITTNNAPPTNDSSNNSKCPSPIINGIRILKVNVLPPKIVMNYGGKVYQGELSESKFRGGETISQLHIPPRNVTTNLPSKIVDVKEGSCVQFAIIGTPRLLPPSSLAVTAYASNNGTAVKVLNAVNSHSSIFRMNLVRGTYILLAVATWLPGSEHVSGYVIYKFMVTVIL